MVKDAWGDSKITWFWLSIFICSGNKVLSFDRLSSSYNEADSIAFVNQVFAWDEVVWANTYGLFKVPAPLDFGHALS